MNSPLQRSGRILFSAVAAAGLMLCGSHEGWAQEKQKYFFKSVPGLAKYTQQHVIDVGDIPGHQIRIYELHTKFGADAPVYDGLKVVEAWTRASSDYTNGSGRNSGYGINLMANGDKIYTIVEVMSQTTTAADGSRSTKFYNFTKLAGGTGRFKGIRGTLVGSGATDFKVGTSDTITQGEYWMEK